MFTSDPSHQLDANTFSLPPMTPPPLTPHSHSTVHHVTLHTHSTSSLWPRCRMRVSYLPYPRRMRIFRAVRILPRRATVDPVVGPLLDAGCRCIPRFSRCRIRGHTSDGVTVTVTLPPFRHHGLRLCRV